MLAACEALASVGWTTWLFWLLFGFALRVLSQARNQDYFLRHLVADANGRLDQRKVMAFCGFLASLWAFVHYAAPHLMPEWMFAVFFLACVAPDLLAKWLDRGKREEPCDSK